MLKSVTDPESVRFRWVRAVVETSTQSESLRSPQLRHLLDDTTKATVERLVGAGQKCDEDRLESAFHDSTEVLFNLQTSFDDPEAGENELAGRVWRHRHNVISDVKAKFIPKFQRRDIENAAGWYLKSLDKAASVDRVFVDVLVAMEFYQFVDTVLNAPHVPILAPSILKRKPILDWIAGRLLTFVGGFVGFAFFWVLNKIGLFPESWLWVIALIMVAICALDAVWTTVWLPKQWFEVRKAQKKISNAVDQMNGIYSALDSSGPISAQHVSDLVKKSSDAGIVWPGPLHVLLEDIMARGGRF